MKGMVRIAIGALVIGTVWLVAGGEAASATVLGIPGNAPTNLPAIGPDDDGVAGLRLPTPEPGVLLLWGTTALGLGVVACRCARRTIAA